MIEGVCFQLSTSDLENSTREYRNLARQYGRRTLSFDDVWVLGPFGSMRVGSDSKHVRYEGSLPYVAQYLYQWLAESPSMIVVPAESAYQGAELEIVQRDDTVTIVLKTWQGPDVVEVKLSDMQRSTEACLGELRRVLQRALPEIPLSITLPGKGFLEIRS